MIEINNLVPPSAKQFNTVIAGIRNAYKSYDRADSELANVDEHKVFAFGKEDNKLARTLIAGDSPSHRKFLRQLPIIMDIKAPLFFWKQLDTYKIGTTANSESTMHCLTKEPFKIEDFSTDHFDSVDSKENNWFESYENGNEFDGLILDDGYIDLDEYFEYYNLGLLNSLREKYLKTKNMNYWYLINELLPQSYLQTRTWSANYEVLLNIIAQRIHHKLPEWRSLIVCWLKNVPFLPEFALAAGIITIKDKDIVINDSIQELLYSRID